MIDQKAKNKIIEIWNNFAQSNREVRNVKGKIIDKIDDKRLRAIEDIKVIINSFLKGDSNLSVFKTSLDSYNKKNNLWGFTATKGQMFFNQLTNVNEQNIEVLTALIKRLIIEPQNLEEGIKKIAELEKFARNFYDKAIDKRKVPNPGSSGYFLSYFWQIENPYKWAIIYTSLIKSFTQIGIWEEQLNQAEAYRYFFNLNEEIKTILSEDTHKEISNWEVEHSFWNYQGRDFLNTQSRERKTQKVRPKADLSKENFEESNVKASFNLSDYLIPKVANLIDIGADSTQSASAKGSKYEALVAEIFKMLDFDVEVLGQGKGRNPDAILRLREENAAFLVDAKAYTGGYSLGLDDRAIREYINHYCPILNKDGYNKIGFIIVSNSFNSNFDGFINEITWRTPIKRFIFMTSEALLYLLAYKIKDNLSSAQIVENIVGCGNLIESRNIIEEFDDF